MASFDVIDVPGGVPIKAWTSGVPVEDQARRQLANVAGLPFVFHHVAAMPDVHWGLGATVGSVIATKGAIIPAALAAWAGLQDGFDRIRAAQPKVSSGRGLAHLGTLGTGNHFIELCLDQDGRVWVMLHSGSRGVGDKIGTVFIELARKDMERFFIHLSDADLAYFPEGTEHFAQYMQAVAWARKFARTNRQLMMDAVLAALAGFFPGVAVDEWAVNCHHNHVNTEKHFGATVLVTRKGAVRAQAGDLGIIPDIARSLATSPVRASIWAVKAGYAIRRQPLRRTTGSPYGPASRSSSGSTSIPSVSVRMRPSRSSGMSRAASRSCSMKPSHAISMGSRPPPGTVKLS